MEHGDDVKKLAALARIGLSPEEEAMFARELPAVLDFFTELAQADTTEAAPLPPSGSVSGRGDERVPADEAVRDRIVVNFPRRAGDSLSVHSVLSTES